MNKPQEPIQNNFLIKKIGELRRGEKQPSAQGKPTQIGYGCKVYCKDCEYCEVERYEDEYDAICRKEDWISDNYFGVSKNKSITYCRNKNYHRDCSDYQKKWWKFWI